MVALEGLVEAGAAADALGEVLAARLEARGADAAAGAVSGALVGKNPHQAATTQHAYRRQFAQSLRPRHSASLKFQQREPHRIADDPQVEFIP